MRSLRRAFQQIIGYVKNPNKTENGKYVSGYACDPIMADAQFVSAKAEYIQRTGRIRGKDDVIAYHMRQAFALSSLQHIQISIIFTTILSSMR